MTDTRTTKIRDGLRDRYGIDDAQAYPNRATAAEDEECFDVAFPFDPAAAH